MEDKYIVPWLAAAYLGQIDRPPVLDVSLLQVYAEKILDSADEKYFRREIERKGAIYDFHWLFLANVLLFVLVRSDFSHENVNSTLRDSDATVSEGYLSLSRDIGVRQALKNVIATTISDMRDRENS